MRTVKSLKMTTATLAFAVGAITIVSVSRAHAAPEEAPYHGCSDGNVCLYRTHAAYDNNAPSNTYFHYRCYNIFDYIGIKDVVNWQTDGAVVEFYYGTNCEDFAWSADPGGHSFDLTKINSIRLTP